MSKWQDAFVGTESSNTTFRTTDQEKERLEELRCELRLTSKGQVIRAALDLLEQIAVTSDALSGQGSEKARRGARRIRRHYGVPRVSDIEAAPSDDAIARRKKVVTSYKYVVGGPDAGVSSPDPAPATDQGEKAA